MLSASARTFYAAFFAVVLLLGSVQARPADETFDQRKAQQARLSPQTAHDMPACRVAALLQMYDGGWGFVFLMANILTGGITRIPMNERITSPDQCQTPEQVRAEAVPKGKMREAFALFSRDQQAAYIDCYAARKKTFRERLPSVALWNGDAAKMACFRAHAPASAKAALRAARWPKFDWNNLNPFRKPKVEGGYPVRGS